MAGVSDPVNDVDLVTARQWCLKRALAREPDDNGKALSLGAEMMRLVEFGPSTETDDGPTAEAQPDRSAAMAEDPEPADGGAETNVLDPIARSDPADADVAAAEPSEDPGAATELRPAMRGVLEALQRRLDAGDEVSLGLLGAELGKTSAAIGYSLRRLKALGYVRAEGNTGNTRWFVLRNADGTPADGAANPAGDDPDSDPDPDQTRSPAAASVTPPDRVRNGDTHAQLMTAAGGKPGERNCLRCQEAFDSAGIKERICKRCKSSPEWRTTPTTHSQGVPS